jgi:hypothetical protein
MFPKPGSTIASRAAEIRPPAEKQYTSKFADWDDKARVRVSPRRLLVDEECSGKVFFPPALVPVANHPLVRELGPSALREILIKHLYGYVDFTANFEMEVINSAAKLIAGRKAGFDLPDQMFFDAYKIYCDEAYHSVFSADIKRQVETVTGIAPPPYDFGAFIRRLDEIIAPAKRENESLARLFIAILFETLISATLNKIPGDEKVVTAIREMVADHADDEARHHFYFASLMDLIWPQLRDGQRSLIAPLLPNLIVKCLEPDYTAARRWLAGFGLAPDAIDQIIGESYPAANVIAGIRKTARATLGILERNGVFAEPAALDTAHKCGLIE